MASGPAQGGRNARSPSATATRRTAAGMSATNVSSRRAPSMRSAAQSRRAFRAAIPTSGSAQTIGRPSHRAHLRQARSLPLLARLHNKTVLSRSQSARTVTAARGRHFDASKSIADSSHSAYALRSASLQQRMSARTSRAHLWVELHPGPSQRLLRPRGLQPLPAPRAPPAPRLQLAAPIRTAAVAQFLW